jgi:hypothetical protein
MLAAVLGVAAWLGVPTAAQAHGPVAPVALDYRARVSATPSGIVAKVVDGDQRMWLRAVAGETVVVLDYRGAPYLRFSPAGVAVNHNSAMYYLNQTPVAATPPASLTSKTPPNWIRVSAGHAYGWHDGRLHALATVALPRGVSFVGRWTVPILLDGGRTAISGGLWHDGSPSVMWFWPIAVLVLCVLAAWRVRRPDLDQRTARLLAVGALSAVAAAAVGRGLHGRPAVSVLQLLEMAIVLGFALWGLVRVVVQRPGFLSYFVVALVALWEGLELVPTLVNGFVLIALPAFVARAATVLALGCGVGLLLMVFRLAAQRVESRPWARESIEAEDETDWELA